MLLEEEVGSGATISPKELKDSNTKEISGFQSGEGKYSEISTKLGEDGYGPWLLVSEGRRGFQGKTILNDVKKKKQ